VAGDAASGAGGVYKLLSGDLPLREALFETWMMKPPATPYEAFLDHVSMLAAERRTALWRRQMVLSPAPEFCLHSEGRLVLPGGFHASTARLYLVGARSGGRFGDGAERLGDP
jgi:hypothetical protein